MNKTILSIDTALYQTSVALLHNHKINVKKSHYSCHHEKKILTFINCILKKKKINIKDINIISFTIGPGNFTGIRIGAAVAQGLSIINNTLLIGISTLKVLAEKAFRKKKIQKIIICIKSHTNKIYWAQYIKINNNWIIKNQEILINVKIGFEKINNLKETWHIIGSGSIYFTKIKNKFIKFINIFQSNAIDLLSLTHIEYKKKNFLNIENIKLNYLNLPQY